MADTELQDERLWPDQRIVNAEAELAAEKQRRAAAKAADQAALLTDEQREQQSMSDFGKMQAVDGRRKVCAEFGFDPGWR